MIKMRGKYKCCWCGFEFIKEFGRIPNVKGELSGGGCSAVKCFNCGHNLKPLQDAITIEEINNKRGGK